MPFSETVTQRRIFWFWLPLAAMWIMMAIEQPVVAAVMARLPDPALNLAAFGVTFALALMVEGPVVMLLTAGTALPKDRQSYQRLMHFTHLMAGGLTALHLLLALTPLYGLLVGKLIGAPTEVIELSRVGFLLMTPWTAAIAYRRLWQGVLIRFNRTNVVPLTIAARLITTTLVLGTGLLWARFPGVYVASVALSLGVTAAMIVSYAFARPTIQAHLTTDAGGETLLTWPDLLTFYVPLALTSLIVLANQPLFSTALARAADPLLSLAVWPVVMSLVFLGRSIALSFQEVAVALLGDRASYGQLRHFARVVAGVLAVIFMGITWTPLARIWFASVAGLSPELVSFALLPAAISALAPAIATLISWQRGVLVHTKQTQYVSRSVMVSLTVLVTMLVAGIGLTPLPGAVVAAVALSVSLLAEWGYVSWRGRIAAQEAGLVDTLVARGAPQSI